MKPAQLRVTKPSMLLCEACLWLLALEDVHYCHMHLTLHPHVMLVQRYLQTCWQACR